jgi:hypothetical protein
MVLVLTVNGTRVWSYCEVIGLQQVLPGTSGKIPYQARQSKIAVWTGANGPFKRFPLAITPYLAFCM